MGLRDFRLPVRWLVPILEGIKDGKKSMEFETEGGNIIDIEVLTVTRRDDVEVEVLDMSVRID